MLKTENDVGKFETFPNPPIVEAVLDIKAELPNNIDINSLAQIYEKISDQYPEKREQRIFSAKLNLTNKEQPNLHPTNLGLQGYHFHSKIENKTVQYKLDGFTFNKLKPYKNWETFKTEAHELWDLYSEIAQPLKVVRIALRYINRFKVPLPLDDFEDYILTNPHVAKGLPQNLSNFLMRLEIPNPNFESLAIITQTMEKPSKTDQLPLILDIDVIREIEYIDNFEKMWEDFENLRIYKNEIFLNSLTDKTKELFK